MSSANPSTAGPREDTPLLHADASPTRPSPPRDEDRHEQEQEQSVIDRQASLGRVDKALKIMFALTISVGTAAVAFTIANMVMGKFGGDRFGYYDWLTQDYQWHLLWQTVLGVVLSIFNLIIFSQRANPLPALINILIYGIDGVFTFGPTVDALGRSDALFGGECRSDLDHPDPDWGSHYPGSLEECNIWEVKYQIITWFWLCLELVVSLVMFAIAITCLIRVHKLRSRRGGDGGNREGNRWTIPAGQVSVEVSVYWGAPAPRGEGRPRQSEAVEENRQEV